MARRDEETGLGAARVLDADEVQGVLSGAFYTSEPGEVPGAAARRPRDATKADAKPVHYKVICISIYTQDLDRLDGMVGDLKSRGMTKANRSALIRAALDQVDLAKVPKGI